MKDMYGNWNNKVIMKFEKIYKGVYHMKEIVSKITKWILKNSTVIILVGGGFYEMFSDQLQYKIGGLSLVFCGMLLVQRNKIAPLG